MGAMGLLRRDSTKAASFNYIMGQKSLVTGVLIFILYIIGRNLRKRPIMGVLIFILCMIGRNLRKHLIMEVLIFVLFLIGSSFIVENFFHSIHPFP